MPIKPGFVEGQRVKTNRCGVCIIENYYSSSDIRIKFMASGYRAKVSAVNLRNGQVNDPYVRHSFGVGYMGEGAYSSITHHKLYVLWCGMLERCYSERFLKLHPAYAGCKVSPRWQCFQQFCEDVYQMPNYGKRGFHLDKDLRVLGNKVYGRKYCSFVPQAVNKFLISYRVYDLDLPTGVRRQHSGGFQASVTDNDKRVTLGTYDTPEEAHAVYVEAKSKIAKRIIVKYKSVLHKDVIKTLSRLGKSSYAELYWRFTH